MSKLLFVLFWGFVGFAIVTLLPGIGFVGFLIIASIISHELKRAKRNPPKKSKVSREETAGRVVEV